MNGTDVTYYMRRARMLLRNAEYHVTARINRQEFVFQDDAIKELLLTVILLAKKKYSFRIRNLCIMSNHIHLMITPGPDENLSRIMQWILSVFAIRFNKMYNLKGHVWYDRFKSKIIYTYRQFLATFDYIARNPVKASIVTHPIEYTYNGIRMMWDKRFEIIDPPDSFTQLGLPYLFDRILLPR